MEQAASEAATNRNMKRIDEYFDKLVAQVEQQRRLAKDSLSSLTPRQQQEIVAFWEIFASFFKEIMEYIGQISNEIAEMAKSGYRLKEGALKSLFEELQYTFDTMFYVN